MEKKPTGKKTYGKKTYEKKPIEKTFNNNLILYEFFKLI